MTQPLGPLAEPLSPYSGDDTTCRKCGHDKASTTYHDFTDPRSGIPVDMLNRAVCTDQNECFSRTCARCGYQWFETVEPTRDSGLTSDRDVAVAARALYQLWYWDTDWRTGATARGRHQVLHELYCAALLGETPEQYTAHQAEDDSVPEQPGVTVPRAAFDLLLSVAERARTGGSTTPLSQRAIEALDAAGLPPKAAAE